MRLLALVTARGGSKRIPGKNIRRLGTKPLVVWSIDVATGIPDVCDILASTDDPAIARVARDAGAMVPWFRPPDLATDTASSVDVCLHALDWYEDQKGSVDGLLLLQPTSPFRSRSTVLRGIKLFAAHQCRPVVGVAPAASHPMWCYRIDGQTMRPFLTKDTKQLRSQDLPLAYVISGVFYLVAPSDLRGRRSFYSDDMIPLIVEDRYENIDIDTEWDWTLAEAFLRMNRTAH